MLDRLVLTRLTVSNYHAIFRSPPFAYCSGLIKISAFLGCQKVNWAVIFSMATGEATGDVQRNRIVKSEQGVNIFLYRNDFFISFLFVSSLFRFVSFPFQRNIVSFRFVSWTWNLFSVPFRFVSENYAFFAFRSVSFRFVPKPWNFLNQRKQKV